ncbi:MAG: VWA domain-containing protein [Pseudomonadales bacterium]|nr:VWA domain-containing protein [Pseudomonadales bacterium]
MKDLFKKSSGQVTRSRSEKPAVSGTREVQEFLHKVGSLPAPGSRSGDAHLIFALDATASRQFTWDRATRLQGEMFVSAQSTSGLQVQLCYFRGLGEFYHSEWHSDADNLLRQMSGLQCQAGMTQIERLLRHAIAQNREQRLRGVIFIGDAMEENRDVLCQLAGKLGLLNVPLFIFQERQEQAARQTFVEMARLSGGAYCQFDAASAEQLKDLLRAVAIYATGGLQALEDFSRNSHQSVKLLGQQLK